jgi:hypothetical protein
MVNIRQLSDQNLLLSTERLVKQERELLSQVLNHLKEIERRRLFSTLGYPSLFEYATKHLKYSESQAHRRISAMRLIKEIPEIEEKVKSGDLNLSNLTDAQTHFRNEAKENNPLNIEQKKDLIEKLKNKSHRQAQQILTQASSNPTKPQERKKVITPELSQITFPATEELLNKLNNIKGLYAHTKPNMSYAELFELMADLVLANYNPARKKSPPKKDINSNSIKQNKATSQKNVVNGSANNHIIPQSNNLSKLHNCQSKTSISKKCCVKYRRKTIPAAIKKAIWQRDRGKCVVCGSTYALEIDHIIPISHGGTNDISNLSLTCRSCNQRAAIEKIGENVMGQYITKI